MRNGTGRLSAKIVSLLVLVICASAMTLVGTKAASANFNRFIENLWPEAQRAGVSRATFVKAFKGVTPDPEVIERAENQAEFKTPIWDYLDLRVSEARIDNGRQTLRKHLATVDAIEKRYGVPKSIIMAIWGMETNYGSHMGDKYVIRSLATLAYTGRRQRFGRQQLIAALKILERGDIPPAAMTGSWAGAMGYTQFIPTTYNAYAVDWNGDGRRDIWRNPADAMASTANYLRKAGWKPGVPWGWEVALPHGFNRKLAGLKSGRSVGDWHKLGVKLANGSNFRADSPIRAYLLLPAGANGPAFLVTDNFKAILRYNNSHAYALAVGHLADRIEGKGPIVANWPRPANELTVKDRMELQVLLSARGYDTGKIDGTLGPQTRSAVMRAQRDAGQPADGEPTAMLLKHLRSDG